MSSMGTINRDFLVSGKYYKPIYHMDIEVFPEWWSIVCRHKGKKHVFTSDDGDLTELQNIVDKAIITAYYGKKYDFKIVYAILAGLSTKLIYELSICLVKYKGYTENALLKRFVKSSFWGEFSFIDLMDDLDKSLKEHESNMGIAIIESSVPWDKKDLTDEEKAELLFYNHHDVVAQEQLFLKRLNGYYLPKLILAEMFELHPINAMKNTNASITSDIFEARKLSKTMLKDRPYIIPENISDYILKYVPEKFIKIFLTTGMDVVNKKEMSFTDFENKGKFGKGGLHSTLQEYIRVQSNDKFKIFLIDVSAYYPNLQIHFDLLSRAAKDKNKLPKIYDKRQFEKANQHKMLEKALKLVLVTLFGATGLKFNNLYDPNMAWSVTITGQLLLYALSKEIWLETGSKIIQDNTDGVMAAVRIKDIPRVKELVTIWEELTGLKMDYEEIDVIAQRDVNNYACKFTDGKTKVKGGLCMQAITCDESAFEVVTYQNWDMRITHEAVMKYLLDKTPIEETIRNCKDLMMFVSTCKTGGTFSHVYKYIDDEEIEIQKVNRVIAVKNKRYGTLKKFKITRGKKPNKPKDLDREAWDDLWDSALFHLNKLIEDFDFDVTDRFKSHEKMKLINDALSKTTLDAKIIKALLLREEYKKVPKISEHSYIMNKDMSEYEWAVWKDRIDYDFYVKIAKDKVEGWLKK